jgi:hypothetical protein
LLQGVADTFIDAVAQFCHHDTLQYTWLRYLPDDKVSDSFWAKLRPKIFDQLRMTPVLRTHSARLLKPPICLKLVPSSFMDGNNEPLLRDLPNEVYLSKSYDTELHSSIAASLGLRDLSAQQLLLRLRADLDSPKSKMKATTTGEDWHTRLASFLTAQIGSHYSLLAKELQALCLVPVQGGRWVRPVTDTTTVSLPETEGMKVPLDLGILLVRPAAAANAARSTLFERLGVQRCDPANVISRIIKLYAGTENPGLMPKDSVDHVRYLHWYESRGHALPQFSMRLFDEDGILCETNELYLKSSEPYSAYRLLGDRPCDAFGRRSLRILLYDYLASPSWLHLKSWLDKTFDISPALRLTSPNDTAKLSRDFRYLLEHRQDALIGVLQYYRTRYSDELNDALLREFKTVQVPCIHGPTVQLSCGWLPLPSLMEKAEELGVRKEMAFLKFPTSIMIISPEEIKYWKLFGVSSQMDFSFYYDALCQFRHESCRRLEQLPQAIVKIYEAIANSLRGKEENEMIRSVLPNTTNSCH